MRFIIWGFGKMGKIAYELLGKERISFFVDINKEYINNQWNGIRIISPEQMVEDYFDEIIVITPVRHEKQIIFWLEENSLYKYFKFSKEVLSLQGFIKQAPHERLLNEIDDQYEIVIYGKTILSYCIQEWLSKNCISSTITEKDDSISEKNDVILSKEIDVKREQQIKKHAHRVWSYYNLSLCKYYYYNKELTKFHNIHQNERCFIVGTGPSLQMKDLDRLDFQNEICISMNGIFKAFPYTKWRPSYYCISDMSGVRLWQENILNMKFCEKFVMDGAWNEHLFEGKRDFHKWHMYLQYYEHREPEFSIDLPRGFYCGKTITFDCCIPLAMYMGFKEIVLVGIDCTQYNSQEQQHFVSDYSEEKSNDARLCVEDNILAYKSAKKYADLHGIKIYNATRGGKLDVFERIDFDSLFEEQ